MPEQPQSLNTWAIVEVMGHKRFAGFASEQVFGSAALIRVDVPETDQPEVRGWNGVARPARKTAAYSKLIGVGSIYCITPCTEEVARRVAAELERHNDPIPVAIPAERQLPASVGSHYYDEDADLDEDEEEDDDLDDGDFIAAAQVAERDDAPPSPA